MRQRAYTNVALTDDNLHYTAKERSKRQLKGIFNYYVNR